MQHFRTSVVCMEMLILQVPHGAVDTSRTPVMRRKKKLPVEKAWWIMEGVCNPYSFVFGVFYFGSFWQLIVNLTRI